MRGLGISNERKGTAELIAEQLREAGTLILVFAPLYALYESKAISWRSLELTLFVGVLALIAGVQLERNRP